MVHYLVTVKSLTTGRLDQITSVKNCLDRGVMARLFKLFNYPQERETSESLNVAIATAVVCAEFRRRLR